MKTSNFKENIWTIVILILMVLAYFIVLVVFTGCGSKADTLKPNSAQTIVVEKKVIVGCEIPKIECDIKGELYEPTIKLLECIKLQKEVIRICTETKYEETKTVEEPKVK